MPEISHKVQGRHDGLFVDNQPPLLVYLLLLLSRLFKKFLDIYHAEVVRTLCNYAKVVRKSLMCLETNEIKIYFTRQNKSRIVFLLNFGHISFTKLSNSSKGMVLFSH